MKVTWIVGMFIIATGGTLAVADTLLDDFDDGISPSIWTDIANATNHWIQTPDPAGLWTVEAPDTEGRLSILKPADDDQSTGNQAIAAGISSLFILDGDFIVSVDFDLLEFPAAGLGYNQAVLGIAAQATGEHFLSLRYVINDMQYVEGFSTATGPVGQISDSTMSGRLEIRRDGQSMSAWIDRGSGAELLRSISDPAFLGPVTVILEAAQVARRVTGYRSFSALDVRYDNFVVTADVIIPEPATLCLLAVGSLALMQRRRARRHLL